MTSKLNIIGCGNTGKTLARLWREQRSFEISGILNRTTKSALAAIEFIGAGHAVESLALMGQAEVFLIGTPDNYIEECCETLAASGLLRPGCIVFHCSGALSSDLLNSARRRGAAIGSIHPVKSFADPGASIRNFDGTFCGVEGDDKALEVLGPAFESIGATTFAVNPEFKTLYHAASVMVCNYLTALMEVGIQAYAKAGLQRDTAMQVMQPIVQGTVDNIFRLGTTGALTGPIARGDDDIVSRQLDALRDWQPHYADLYRDLGRVALQLSRQQGNASDQSLSTLAGMLEKHHAASDNDF